MTRLRIAFGGSTVAVETGSPRADGVLDFLFGGRPDAATEPHVTLRVADDGGRLSLHGDDPWEFDTDSGAALAEYLQGRVCYHLADRSAGGLLFHAAALEWGGRLLVIPGTSGAGKSTLTAWLCERGFAYRTDELVYVPDGAGTAGTFTRPLNLKPAARALFPSLADARGLLECETATLVPPARLGHKGDAPAPFGAILFVRYDPTAPFEWSRLSGAQAGMALMQCLVNARNLPEHGFREAARIARQTPAYRLVYGGFEQLAPHLPELQDLFPRSDPKVHK